MDIRPIDANAVLMHEKFYQDIETKFVNRAVAGFVIEGAPTLSLNMLRDSIYQDAVEHGLWEESDRLAKEAAEDDDLPSEKSFIEKFFKWHEAAQLIFFEGDEMLTAVEEYNWDSATEELADVVIMAMSAAGYLGIDIDAAIRRKMEINKGRAWKHGKE